MYTNKGELRSGSRCLVPVTETDEAAETQPDLNPKFKNLPKPIAVGSNATFEKCNPRDSNQVWYFEPMNLHEASGRFIHKPSGLCLGLKSQKKGDTKQRGPKSVLNYLARVAQDITKDVERPILAKCTGGERWSMNGPAEWEKVGNKRTSNSREET